MRFEWDEAKARANVVKHGIAFERAVEVFEDPLARTGASPYLDGEFRDELIGATRRLTLLHVVYTVRVDDEGEVNRIISARKVSSHERGLTKPTVEVLDAQEARLASMRDEEIDFSDSPEVTDFSTWVRVSDYPDLKSALAASRALKAKKLAAE